MNIEQAASEILAADDMRLYQAYGINHADEYGWLWMCPTCDDEIEAFFETRAEAIIDARAHHGRRHHP